MKRVLFFFLLILSIHFINAQPLSQRLDALLHEEVLKTSEVGIAVFDLTTGKSVYRYQDEKLYRPASVPYIMVLFRACPWMVAGSSILIRWKASGSTSASLGSAVPVVRPISVVSFLLCRDMCMR